MCGIVGVVSTEGWVKSTERERWFRNALFTNTLRGNDSTGMFFVDKDNDKIGSFKKALHAPDFLDLKKADDIIDDIKNYNIIIGHNRAATKGIVNARNAHPFTHDGITLVHNGTLYNHRDLKGCKDFFVDSEAITWSIANNGVDYTLENINGAFTLVWYDESDKILRIARNEQRPLSIGYVKNSETMLLASESSMLKWISERNNIELEGVYTPAVGKVYEIDPEKKLRKFTDREVALYKPKTYDYGEFYNNGYYRKGGAGDAKGKKSGTGQGTTNTGTRVLSKLNLQSNQAFKFRLKDVTLTGCGRNHVSYMTLHGIPEDYTSVKFPTIKVVVYSVPYEGWEWLYAAKNIVLEGRISSAYKTTDNGCSGVTISLISTSIKEVKPLALPGKKEKDSGNFPGPNGLMLSSEDWTKQVQDGCDMCTGPVYIFDHLKTGWTAAGQPICKDCIATGDYEEYLV